MYQTREHVSTKIPIARKGTKYVAAALSHKSDAVPVVVALRDMLHLATTAREVKQMLKQKAVKINGRNVRDYRESIKIFNILQADKTYRLTLLPTARFSFEEVPSDSLRLCRVSNKKILHNNVMQLNLHDGSNIPTKSKIDVGDSVYLDSESKIKSHISLEKGKKAFVFKGKYIGHEGTIKEVKDNKVTIQFGKGDSAVLNKDQLIVM